MPNDHLHRNQLTITRAKSEQPDGYTGKVIWFTCCSGSGKSTRGDALVVELHACGLRTCLLDGDNMRRGLNRDLGFSEADRLENTRRIAEVARLMMEAGLVVLKVFISPFARVRELARALIGSDDFLEVYVGAPREVCEQRDVKGIYMLACTAKIAHMTGIDSRTKPPRSHDCNADAANRAMSDIVQDLMKLSAPADPPLHAIEMR